MYECKAWGWNKRCVKQKIDNKIQQKFYKLHPHALLHSDFFVSAQYIPWIYTLWSTAKLTPGPSNAQLTNPEPDLQKPSKTISFPTISQCHTYHNQHDCDSLSVSDECFESTWYSEYRANEEERISERQTYQGAPDYCNEACATIFLNSRPDIAGIMNNIFANKAPVYRLYYLHAKSATTDNLRWPWYSSRKLCHRIQLTFHKRSIWVTL